MTHSPDLHLVDLSYPRRHLIQIVDAPRAKLHVDKCPCGALTVRPYGDELMEMMEREWGVRCTVDEQARAYILSETYDPAERNDLADREVWPEAVA